MPKDSIGEPLCAICGKHPQTERYRPFCSKRCADVDLNRWLGGHYAIPSKQEEDEDELPLEHLERPASPTRTN